MQKALDVLSKACSEINMKPNPLKCEILVVNFGGRKLNFSTDFYINNVKIPVVDKLKLLGVHFTSKYEWNYHISKIVSLAVGKLYQLKKLFKSGFSISELIHAFNVYIRSGLEYCAVIWGPGLPIKLIHKLEKVQKIALSIILRKRVDHTNYIDVLNSFKIESLEMRRDISLKKFGFKLIIGRYSVFLPEFGTGSSSMMLRKTNIVHQTNIKNAKYYNSTLPTLIRLINSEYREKNTIFSCKYETILMLKDKNCV